MLHIIQNLQIPAVRICWQILNPVYFCLSGSFMKVRVLRAEPFHSRPHFQTSSPSCCFMFLQTRSRLILNHEDLVKVFNTWNSKWLIFEFCLVSNIQTTDKCFKSVNRERTVPLNSIGVDSLRSSWLKRLQSLAWSSRSDFLIPCQQPGFCPVSHFS